MGQLIEMPRPARVEWALEYLQRFEALRCRGCNELIEIPMMAILKNGTDPVEIRGNPENQLLWRELMELKHRHHLARLRK